MKEFVVTLPNDKKVLIVTMIEKYSIPAIMLNFGDLTRYELRVDDFQTNILLEELRAVGIGTAYGEIAVHPISLLISSEKIVSNIPRTTGINRDEVFANLSGLSTLSGEFLLLTFLAAILAGVGLINNSSVVIISSMIVAPLLGPIAITSLGLLSLQTTPLIRKGIIAEIIGILLTIITGGVVGYIFQNLEKPISPPYNYEIMSRTEISITTISMALLGGIAAGIIIARGLDVSIVGVAIAASLCPPAANIGILIALFEYDLAIQSGFLLLLNIFAINLSCSLIFWLFDVRGHGLSKRQTMKIKRLNLIWVVLVAIITILILLLTFL